jgi:hypothetical protein
MTVENTPPGRGGAAPKTVQEYIDETPMWADATAVRYSPMTNMQWLAIFLGHCADTALPTKSDLAP